MINIIEKMRMRGIRAEMIFEGLLDLGINVMMDTPMIKAIQAEPERARRRVVKERKKVMGKSKF